MTKALEGIKVLDVSQVAAVPMATRFMADFGADVLHVEHPTRGDLLRGLQELMKLNVPDLASDFDYLWENYNRNKRGLAIDVSTDEGREILLALVKDADIFMSNLRTYEIERYRLSYEELRAANPRLIYGNLTGYGRKGPSKNIPAFDSTAHWGRAGIAYRLTYPWMPPLGGVGGFGDNVSALALYAGVTTALYARERTGIGQEIEVSLMHTGLYQLSYELSAAVATGFDAKKKAAETLAEMDLDFENGNLVHEVRALAPNPLVVPYETKDGRWMLLSVVNRDRYWGKFCDALGRHDFEDDPRFATRVAIKENAEALFHILEETFRAKTLDEWRPRFADIPSAPVQNYTEAIADPQTRENEFIVPFKHPVHGQFDVIANPIRMSGTPAVIDTAAPTLGQHTDEILRQHGYTPEQIKAFRENEVIF
ncbi:MAG: CoA transferase [Candidatus Hydrogenedentes bacterium]|jgi:formyl-CoA transferase|nr:CoA transferase [Candidatus Hydrogenedentota bacterium]